MKETGSNTAILINGEELKLQANQEIESMISKPGIFQVKIKDNQAVKSVFILSEPVEHFKQ